MYDVWLELFWFVFFVFDGVGFWVDELFFNVEG